MCRYTTSRFASCQNHVGSLRGDQFQIGNNITYLVAKDVNDGTLAAAFSQQAESISPREFMRYKGVKMVCRIILAAIVAISAFRLNTMEAFADETPTVTVEQLRDEMSCLKQENEALRRENQRLRAMLLERGRQNVVGQSGSGDKHVQRPAGSELADEYWLTTNSKKRHNSKCRNYKKTKGRPCVKDEGTPCKICGG